jgi:hypothetical protein
MSRDIDSIVARFAPPPVTETGEGARELMQEIMATEPAPAPRRSRRWPNLRVAIPASALLTLADPAREDPLDYDTAKSVPELWHVSGGYLTEPGVATIIVHQSPMEQKKIDTLNKANGCPAS